MRMCKECGEVFSALEMTDGICKNCATPEFIESSTLEKERLKDFNNNKHQKLESILVTTETSTNLEIEKRINIVSAQCVYGLNIVKDLFAGIRDIVGGRIKSIEDPLEEATKTIIKTLKEKAYLAGGDAVIGIKIEHTYSNPGNSNMVSILGTGTIIKLKSNT
jgi:uncharacterized protein YbjQ (UPF0145 family)